MKCGSGYPTIIIWYVLQILGNWNLGVSCHPVSLVQMAGCSVCWSRHSDDCQENDVGSVCNQSSHSGNILHPHECHGTQRWPIPRNAVYLFYILKLQRSVTCKDFSLFFDLVRSWWQLSRHPVSSGCQRKELTSSLSRLTLELSMLVPAAFFGSIFFVWSKEGNQVI